MNRLFASDVINATGGKLISGFENATIDSVCMDSREVVENSLFVAIPGARTDGHNYIEMAYEKGASCALVSKEMEVPEGLTCILVDETISALQKLSRWYLETKLNMKKIAVTGSVGKTTTRDFLYAAVSGKYRAGKNNRNFNSDIGLPLTILTFDSGMEVGVMEMGTSGGIDEVAVLAELAGPDAAIITNIGVSHIEILGSRENILKAKMGITKCFSERNTLVINADDDMLSTLDEKTLGFNLVRVGTENALTEVDYLVHDVKELGLDEVVFKLDFNGNTLDVRIPVPGEHNALNAALAIAGAKLMGVTEEEAVDALHNMTTTGSRLRIVDTGKFEIIDDSYNAAPASMKSAIVTLMNGKGDRKIAVLGDMNELGEKSRDMHYEVGEFAAARGVDIVIAVGEKAMAIADGALEKTMEEGRRTSVIRCENKEDAYTELIGLLDEGDLVLVKASRGMQLDELVKKLEEK